MCLFTTAVELPYRILILSAFWHDFSGGQAAVTAAPVLPKKEESGVLMVMNLPDSLTDDHVRELLSPFGELKRFNLLKVRVWGRGGG